MELYEENTGTLYDQNHKDRLNKGETKIVWKVQLLHLDLSPDLGEALINRYPDNPDACRKNLLLQRSAWSCDRPSIFIRLFAWVRFAFACDRGQFK